MVNSEIKQKFLEDASYLSKELEHLILDLETFHNPEILNPIFARVHHIKVAAQLCGFKRLSVFCHKFEGFITSLKKGERPISKSAVTCIICSRELIATALATYSVDNCALILFDFDFNISDVTAPFELKRCG